MKNPAIAIVLGVSLASCATYEPSVPSKYVGPTAVISDTHVPESKTMAQFFVLVEINGKPTYNALNSTRVASAGQGFFITARNYSREVPAQPVKVKIQGTTATGAPIQALVNLAAGRAYFVEGEVSFIPKDRGQYIVTGKLGEKSSSVWIEDLNTFLPVTEKITAGAASSSDVPNQENSGSAVADPPMKPITCDKWGNPKDSSGNPCQK